MKRCAHCGETKSFGDFHIFARSPDGRQSYCKDCGRRLAREHYYRNREKARTRSLAYQRKLLATSEGKALKAKRDRETYERHRDERVAKVRAYAAQKIAEGDVAFREARLERSRLRRARVKGASVYAFTHKDWDRQRRRQNGCCFYCGEIADLQLEHLIPIARGGSHSIGNIVGACRQCNQSKSASLVVEFRVRQMRRVSA